MVTKIGVEEAGQNGAMNGGDTNEKNGHTETVINLKNQNEANDEGKETKDKDENEEEDKENSLPPVPFFQLFKYANTKEKWLMVVGMLAAMVVGCCMPVLFILFGDVTEAFVVNEMINTLNGTNISEIVIANPDYENFTKDEIISSLYGEQNFLHEIAKFVAGAFIVSAVQMAMGYISVTSMNYAAEGQVFRLRGRFLKSILRQEIGWYDTHQTNDFASRVTKDLNKLQEGIGEQLGMFIFFMTITVASLLNAFVHGWELTLVILSVFPLLFISAGLIAKVQSNLTLVEIKEYAKAGSIAEEVISGIRTVVAFGGESKEVARYDANLVNAKRTGVKRGLMTGIGLGVLWFHIYAAYALAFYYGTGLILESRSSNDNKFQYSNFLIVFYSVLMGAMNVGQAAPYVEAFNIARGAAATIFNVIERKSAIDPTSSEGEKPSSVKGMIEFKDVHFSYPSRPDVKVLQGVSLTIEPGQTVALVGSSGCGKSTCIQLIQRFYDTLEGHVFLDDREIKSLNIGWLRDQIGVVGQEPVLFATTIAENIRYGRDGVSMEDIKAAAKEANAHDFIMKMPKQYDTNVGERGSQMSGGQKQRIAIARALIRQPKILLLDEATSALDTQSEAVVQQALDKARKGRTTVVVAHRLSTIKPANKIVVFNKGVIEEVGTHNELMKLQGLYYNLVTAQVTPQEQKKSEKKNDEILDMDAASEFSQEIIDDIASMSPVALARSPSIRQSLNRRKASSVKPTKTSLTTKKEEEEELPEVSTWKILEMNASEWPYIVGGVVGSAIQGTTIPLYGILIGEILGTFSIAEAEEARSEANFYALLFLLLGIVAALSMFMQAYMFSISGEALTSRLRKLTFAAMIRQEIGWFDEEKNSVGALCSKLSGDAAAIQGATGSRVGTIVQAITALGISIALALYYDWRLGLVTLPFMPSVLIALHLQNKILMGQSVTESKVLEEAGKIAIEAITNIRTVAGLHKEEHFANEYSNVLFKAHQEALRKSHVRGAVFGFAQAISFFGYAVCLWYGGYLVSIQELTYENLFKVAQVIILSTMLVGQAVALAPNYSKAKVAAARIFNLLERRPAIETSSAVGLRLSGPVTDIELQNVHFTYPTRPDITILKGLGVRVERGKTLALVGSSGCGKSTIISLLERFYDAKSGRITVSGEDLQALNVGYVRNQLGLVSQEPVLFDLTIGENIAYGDNCREVTEDEIISAAKQANIHNFVESLPQGYKTRVGSKGTQLSGGQKQRIAIARALVRNPSVLLLDEATSALDTESEKVVQEALERAQEGRTSIVIAHRLSTIQNADTIAVVQGGVVVEAGTHDELMKNQGPYYDLYQTNH